MSEEEPGTKVFVGNISDAVEVETIRNEFQKFGEVIDIAFDIASAYITYDRHNEAQDAVSKMNGKEFMGEKLKVEIYVQQLSSDYFFAFRFIKFKWVSEKRSVSRTLFTRSAWMNE